MGISKGVHFRNEELLYKALELSKRLGYRSFSDFVESLLRSAIYVYEHSTYKPKKRATLEKRTALHFLKELVSRTRPLR